MASIILTFFQFLNHLLNGLFHKPFFIRVIQGLFQELFCGGNRQSRSVTADFLEQLGARALNFLLRIFLNLPDFRLGFLEAFLLKLLALIMGQLQNRLGLAIRVF